MLWLIFVLLLILWLAGVVASYTLGGFIHMLLALAVLVLLAQVIKSSRGPRVGTNLAKPRKDDETDTPDDERVA